MPTVLTALVLASALLPSPGDLVPAAIEKLLQQPPDANFFGIPPMLDAQPLAHAKAVGTVRCLADVGDVTGDGAPDVALGGQPRTGPTPLSVRDGRTGALVWGSSLAGDGRAGFRSLRGLEARDGRLAAAGSSRDGRVVVVDAASGALLWQHALASDDPGDPADLYAVSWVDDVDGDDVPDLAVAGGHRIDALALLSGSDGATIALHLAGDVVYDVRPAHDLDGDGHAELAIVGGDVTPYARLLSGSDLALRWDVPLGAPGSSVLALDDVDGDGTDDIAVGEFAAPAPCLVALDGALGSTLWSAGDMTSNVTSLSLIDDMLDTGVRDIAVGSFDNAVSGVLAFYGFTNWRREGTSNNGGHMLAVAAASDLDDNGYRDVFAAALDRRPYVMGGDTGQFMAAFECRAKLCSVLALGDGNGDGRPELVVGGQGTFWIFDGNAGTSDGPFVEIDPPLTSADETSISAWAYPTSTLLLYLSPTRIEPLSLPGLGGKLELDPSSLMLIFESVAPGAGISTITLSPFPASAAGIPIFCQALTKYPNGAGWISNMVSFTLAE